MTIRARVALISLIAAATSVLVIGPASSDHAYTGRSPAHRVDLTAAHARARDEPARPPHSMSANATLPGDVTGDGLADAVVRDPGADSGSLRVYTHDGATSSNPWTSFELAAGDWDFADVLLVGDVTGDDQPDLVARDPALDDGTLWVYPHDGSATGNPWPDASRFRAGTGWNKVDRILLGDVTGDSRADLLAREPGVSAGTLLIYPHDGAAGANPWTGEPTWAGTGWNLANTMSLDDVTGDGNRDIVVRDSSGSLWVYPHDGVTSGNPYTSRFSAGAGWEFADSLLTVDVTGDGHSDIIARDAGELWVYPHDGVSRSSIGFAWPTSSHTGASNGNPYTVPRFAAGSGWDFANALIAGDVTGDGRPELLARVHAGDLWLYSNSGAGVDEPWSGRVSAGTHWAFENALAVGDVTGDGRPDLVARDPAVADGTLWVYQHAGGTAGNPWTVERTKAGTGWNLATAMLLGDLTGDGWADVLVRDRAGDLWIHPHSGSATTNPWTVRRVWAGTGWNTSARLTLGDVNGDGMTDLIDHERDGTLWIYVTGSSGSPIQVPGDWASTDAIAVGDVDGSGNLDLVTRDESGALWIHSHDGSSTGNPWTSSRTAGSGWSFASAFLL